MYKCFNLLFRSHFLLSKYLNHFNEIHINLLKCKVTSDTHFKWLLSGYIYRLYI